MGCSKKREAWLFRRFKEIYKNGNKKIDPSSPISFPFTPIIHFPPLPPLPSSLLAPPSTFLSPLLLLYTIEKFIT